MIFQMLMKMHTAQFQPWLRLNGLRGTKVRRGGGSDGVFPPWALTEGEVVWQDGVSKKKKKEE